MIKKNDIIKIEINSITNLGFGVGRFDGLVIFAAGTVAGDVCEVKIIKIISSYAVGRVEKFLKKSAFRDEKRCPVSLCTSCAYKLISYDKEREIKREYVKSAFAKAGLSDINIHEVTASPSLTEYRNKAQYPISSDKNGNYIIGFYAPKSHRVTEARNCPLSPSVFSQIIDTLSDFFKKYSIPVYDEECGKGLLRHIYLRRGEVSGEVILTLVIAGDTLPHAEEAVGLLTKKYPSIVGILLNINKKNTNVILGEKYITLYGRDYIYDTLGGVKLKITVPAFYQVNHGAAELLYTKAKELAAPKKSDTLLDLYCGAGSIGLSMADSVSELIGVEIVESAVICANENAERAGYKNARFYTGDAAVTEKLLDNAEHELGRKIEPNIIILDPPRAGCDEGLIKYASSLSPERIVYISCNPATLARDCAIFKNFGYVCTDVTPFDLFPMTGHVEAVVLLTQNSK